MSIKVKAGDRVLVNIAPFIGSMKRSDDSIPCEVLDVDGPEVQVRTEEPYRIVSLWVLASWIDGAVERGNPALAGRGN
jgi:hypothetical protein